jgi:hypothetical protein
MAEASEFETIKLWPEDAPNYLFNPNDNIVLRGWEQLLHLYLS